MSTSGEQKLMNARSKSVQAHSARFIPILHHDQRVTGNFKYTSISGGFMFHRFKLNTVGILPEAFPILSPRVMRCLREVWGVIKLAFMLYGIMNSSRYVSCLGIPSSGSLSLDD